MEYKSTIGLLKETFILFLHNPLVSMIIIMILNIDHFQDNHQKLMQIIIGDSDGIYTAINSQQSQDINVCLDCEITMNNFKDELDGRLHKYVKNHQSIAVSPKGTQICFIQSENGDIIIYSTLVKKLSMVKGVLQGSKYVELIETWINDEGSVLLIKTNDEHIWMWTKSQEQYIHKELSPFDEKVTQQKNSLLYRSNSYDRRGSIPNIENVPNSGGQLDRNPIQLKGSWNKIMLNQEQSNQILDPGKFSLDVNFESKIQNSSLLSEQISLYSARLLENSNYSEEAIIEFQSLKIRHNNLSKGGNYYEASTNIGKLNKKLCQLEFVTTPLHTKSPQILTRMDSRSQLSFTILNSSHMLYCQSIFTSFDTSISVIVKLFDFVKPDDCPSFDNRGKTNLCIDDISWTNNDAFVIIIFNSCTLAILPRLGSTLIAFFNPTISNISMKMADLNQQYRIPRNFNELILPLPVVQKHSQIKQQMGLNRKTIRMNGLQESFLITDQGLSACYHFKLHFEPELSELFGKTNMSFFFVRFCISLERLAVDQDILEKIPQLLTNKLPLFEFDKNAELDEEEDPGQIIMTASQINPFQHGLKRMETNQSFNADFALDCQTVLVNLKHLLLSIRWNKSQPINYFQWIVTVVNDCFYYFLKNSEPLYAYHALRMGEAYCKNILFATTSEVIESEGNISGGLIDLTNLPKFNDPVLDLYDYHNTKEYMSKQTSEKLEIHHNLFENIPAKLANGSGHWRFQFTKNYTLLVYYSLIQFRNYQAANFNILFLVFACYIMQRYLDSMFHSHIQSVIQIVHRNFQLKKKSDDYELFLGKSGKNMILSPAEKFKAYHIWTNQVLKYNLDHLSNIYEQDNFETLMDTCINQITGNNEKVQLNLGYLGSIGTLLNFVNSLSNQKSEEVLSQLKKLIQIHQTQSSTFIKCSALYIFTHHINLNEVTLKHSQPSLFHFISSLHRLIISSSISQSNNFSSSFSQRINSCFKSSSLVDHQKFMNSFDDIQKRQMLSILYLHLNEIQMSCDILTISEKNELFLFKMLLMSNVIKNGLKLVDIINKDLKFTDLVGPPQFNTNEQVQKFQIKACAIHSIRKSLNCIKESFQALSDNQISSQDFSQYETVSATFIILPANSSNVLREQMLFQSVKNMSKIIKYIKTRILNVRFGSDEIQEEEKSMAEKFLISYLIQQGDNQKDNQVIQCLNSLLSSTSLPLRHMFYHYLNLTLICLMSYGKPILTKQDHNSDYFFNHDMIASNLQPLIVKSYQKFSKILLFIQSQIQMMVIEQEISFLNNRKMQGKEISKDYSLSLQIKYFEKILLVSKFEKYHHSQIMVSKALNQFRQILKPLISENEKTISECFKLITYASLNRANKQKLAVILESLKNETKNLLGQLIKNIENIMYEASVTTLNDSTVKQTYFDLHLVRYEHQLLTYISQYSSFKKEHETADLIVMGMKLKLLEGALQLRELLGISFDESYFYDKTRFTSRKNILGLTNSLIDKYKSLKEKRLHQKQQKAEEKIEDQPLSFRPDFIEVKEKVAENMLSLESARHYAPMIESPRLQKPQLNYRPVTLQANDNPQSDIAKVLMKSRQNGQPDTPRGQQQDKSIIIDLQRLNSSKQIHQKMRRESSLSSENDNEALERPIIQCGTIQEDVETKRKNSVRRYIGIAYQVVNKNQQQDKNEIIQQLNNGTVGVKHQHRKGQMSVAVGQGNHFGSFNFGNQKLPSHQMKGVVTTNAVTNKSGPPPGLPKSSIKRVPLHSISKQDAITTIQSIYETQCLKHAFMNWRQLTPHSGIKGGTGPFNLLLVKKDGTQISLHDLNALLCKIPQAQQVQQHIPQARPKEKMSKDHKRQIMKRFKAIQERLDRVQREADLLNQDFMQKLN